MDFSFKIENDRTDEIIRAKDLAIERALTVIGDKCATYAANLAPWKTGTLSRSIDKKVRMSEEAVYVGTNVEYATYQEFGTSRMKAANGGKGYLRPALFNHLEEYKNIANEELRNAGL